MSIVRDLFLICSNLETTHQKQSCKKDFVQSSVDQIKLY